jgi:two-component system response regulator AtoC
MAMQVVRAQVNTAASVGVPVLIFGEKGAGKETIARMIHRLSPWQNGPFLKVNCASISEPLLKSAPDSKLPVSGNSAQNVGQIAQHGTLFLDEVSELDLTQQRQMTPILPGGTIYRAEGSHHRQQFRTISTTDHSLQKQLERGTFCSELFYRINGISIHLPALRERRGDIEGLVGYFLEHYGRKYNCRTHWPTGESMTALRQFSWTGNISELKNLIRSYVLLGNESVITTKLATGDQKFRDPELNMDVPLELKKLTSQITREVENKIILKALQAHHWNRRLAAQALSISYRSLLYKIRDAGLSQHPSNRGLRVVAG